MARDYENSSNIEDLDDDELRQLVRERLAEHPNLDPDDIEVEVTGGMVRLGGRVGTESEVRIADHVLTDVVGLVEFDNSLVVDELRRVETPLDPDEHLQAEARSSGSLLGEMPEQSSDEADLALDDADLGERMFGTTNYQDAVAHGTSYSPPDAPTPEGLGGRDARPSEDDEER